jgi:hypothetical protein
MEDVDKEISEMKLSLNARARIVAESYLVTVSFHHTLSRSLLRPLCQSYMNSAETLLWK